MVTLIRAIHKMGIPASGKNLFPSNIQGLPTWFTIRVSKDASTKGYLFPDNPDKLRQFRQLIDGSVSQVGS